MQRLTLSKIREALRIHASGLSTRKIATSLATDPGLATKAGHIAILVPKIAVAGHRQRPPFPDEEVITEAMAFDVCRRFGNQRPDQRGYGDLGLAEPFGIEVVAKA